MEIPPSIKPEESLDDFLSKELDPIDSAFLNNYEEFIKQYPLANQNNNTTTKDELTEKTKEVIDKFFQYQKNYYQILNSEIDKNRKLKDVYELVFKKYSTLLKKQNALDSKIEEEKFKTYLTNTLDNKDIKTIDTIVQAKKNEDVLNNSVLNLPINTNTEDVFYSKKETKNLLINAIQNITKNKGCSLESLLVNSLSEEEKQKLKLLNDKYELNQGTSTNNMNNVSNLSSQPAPSSSDKFVYKGSNKPKLAYVISSTPDEIDNKLDAYLNEYYNKHSIFKIPFKKTSKNNYEYGTQKVVIKLEGENFFRVKYLGGYTSIEKYIELNANPEQAKLRKPNNSKKKIMKKK